MKITSIFIINYYLFSAFKHELSPKKKSSVSHFMGYVPPNLDDNPVGSISPKKSHFSKYKQKPKILEMNQKKKSAGYKKKSKELSPYVSNNLGYGRKSLSSDSSYQASASGSTKRIVGSHLNSKDYLCYFYLVIQETDVASEDDQFLPDPKNKKK